MKLQKAQLSLLKDSDFDRPVAKLTKQQTESLEEAAGTLSSSKDSEELITVYNNLKSALEELKTKICPLLEEAQKDDICTTQGLTYLEVKHLLLLHYCICLLFYILLKVEGTSVENHPVVLRLVEIRTFLEKMKPMELRLQPQVDKLLKAISLAKEDESKVYVA